MPSGRTIPGWEGLSDPAQLAIADAALRHAFAAAAEQAEVLADAIYDGSVSDLGGAEALRLLSGILRLAMDRNGVLGPVAGRA